MSRELEPDGLHISCSLEMTSSDLDRGDRCP
jgi:hypothetical protein